MFFTPMQLQFLLACFLQRYRKRLFMDNHHMCVSPGCSTTNLRTFHNIAFMVIFSIFFTFLLHSFGIKFVDSFFFSFIGYGTHLFEDALVFKVGYLFLWPFSRIVMGFGLFPDVLSQGHRRFNSKQMLKY